MRFTKSMIENPKVHFRYPRGFTDYWRHSTSWDDDYNLVVDFARNVRGTTHRANCRLIRKTLKIWNGNYGRKFGQARATCYIPRTGIPEDTQTKKDNKQQDNSNLEDWRPYMQKIHDVILERMGMIQ